MKRTMRRLLLVVASLAASAAAAEPPVAFDDAGVALVDGRPFFPIGIYVYELSDAVMADIKAKNFNVVIGNGFRVDQLDFIHQNGMMAVPIVDDEFVTAGKDHPALLAWYVRREPPGIAWS